MKHRCTTAILAALAVFGGLVACTATDLAVGACSERTHLVTLADPDEGPTLPYRPAHRTPPLPDGAGIFATGAGWVVPDEGLGPGTVHYGVYLGMKDDPGHEDVCFVGGSIVLEASHKATTWSQWHDWDAAAIITSPRAQIIGTRFYNVADGISFSRHPAEDWAARGVHVRQAHDDCIEADSLHSGTIRDAFLDGCFVAVSAKRTASSTADGTGETVTIRDSLVRMQPMPHPFQPEWSDTHYLAPGHSRVFKMGSGPSEGRSPDLVIHDSVFVLEQYPNIKRSDPSEYDPMFIPTYDPDGDGPRSPVSYLKPANCSGNTLVWLGAGSPTFDPALPACFTVLTGRAARTFWAERRAAWLDTHPLAWQRDEHPEVFAYDELG